MSITRLKKWLLGGAIAVATLVPFGANSTQAAESTKRVLVKTLNYRSNADQTSTQKVRWGRGYYRTPYGAYYGGPRGYGVPRYYSAYRGGYYAPYGGHYGRGYYGGGVRVGGLGVFGGNSVPHTHGNKL